MVVDAKIGAGGKMERGAPVLLDAEKMEYDQKEAIVTATGKVEILQGDYILLADSLTYNQNTNSVKAKGNVAVLEPAGNVYFAQEVELKKDLQEGVIDNFQARLSDNSLFAAREARKESASVTKLKKAVYSPCKICPSPEGEADPLWQIKADKVKIDEKKQEVTYRNAFFEVYGVPVIYTPYFSHPTPGADNKSGFLVPEYSQSSNLGAKLITPYYYSIAPDKDFTLTPIFTSDEGLVLAGEYRQLFESGDLHVEGSITRPDRRDALGNVIDGTETRGHIRGRGTFALNEDWNWGFDVNRSTDDTYLRRYDFGSEDSLTSRIYTEGIRGRAHAIVQSLAFQGLNVNDSPGRTPLIAPLAEASYETDPGFMGSRFTFLANSLVLLREIGSESRRLSFTGGWVAPLITGSGHIFKLATSLRSDLYSVNDVTRRDATTFDGFTGRVVPEAELSWRYPLIKRMGEQSVVIEPLVSLALSPNGGNSDKIPNEDNQSLEFSDANIFYANRYPGYDVVESGPRINYGLRAQWQWGLNKDVQFTFGQTYHATRDRLYPFSDGDFNHYSDYVGRVGIDYAPLNLTYRFKLDKDTLAARRHELNAQYSWNPLSLGINYIDVKNDPVLNDKEEILGSVGYNFKEHWTLSLTGRRDLSGQETVSTGASLMYQNECIGVIADVNRSSIRDRDIKPDTSFTVRVLLKNLN